MRELPPVVREHLGALKLGERERSFLRYVRVTLFNSSIPKKLSNGYLEHLSWRLSMDREMPAVLRTFSLPSDFSFEEYFISRIVTSEELDRILNGDHPSYNDEWLSFYSLEDGHDEIRRFEAFLLGLTEGKDTPLMVNIWNDKLEENQGDDSLALLQLLSEHPPLGGLKSALCF